MRGHRVGSVRLLLHLRRLSPRWHRCAWTDGVGVLQASSEAVAGAACTLPYPAKFHAARIFVDGLPEGVWISPSCNTVTIAVGL